MNRSVKQTAQALDISEQYVRKLIKSLPEDTKPIKVKGSWIISDKDFEILAAKVSKTNETSSATSSEPVKSSATNRETELENRLQDALAARDALQRNLDKIIATNRELSDAIVHEQKLNAKNLMDKDALVLENKELKDKLNLLEYHETSSETPVSKEPENVDIASDTANETSSATSSKPNIFKRIFTRRKKD